jgi:hypothetical protein
MTTYLSGNRGILKMYLAHVLLLGVTACNTEPRGASRAEAPRWPAVQDLTRPSCPEVLELSGPPRLVLDF